MSREDLRSYLQHSLLIGDGAMATQLYQLGVPAGVCYEELCLSNPDLVRMVHESYVKAGAGLIETNTFGVNRDALARYGLEHEVKRLNTAAAAIAREAAGDNVYVLGSMGSITAGRVPPRHLADHRFQFEEQAAALLQGEVDGLILETFQDLEELLLAVEVIRPLTSLPLFTQVATLEVGRTRDGYTVSEAFRLLKKAGADVTGLNCRLGPAEMLRTLESCEIPSDTLISVFANAGRLGLADGEYAYKSSPAYFSESALRFRDQGVRVIGGCCGTTPEHIKAMADALAGLAPVRRVDVRDENQEQPCHQADTGKRAFQGYQEQAAGKKYFEYPSARFGHHQAEKTIVDLVQERHTVIVELDPPKDLDTKEFFQGCQELHKAGADAITLADNSLANVRMSNMALAAIMKSRYGIEPLVHITCRDRNLIGQQSHLMGMHALDINQLLVITGDPSRFGDLPGASAVFDVNSFDLIRLTKQLNTGISFSGRPLKQKAKFIVGAAFNPYVRQFESAVKRLEQKVAAGADYVMTQPVYDAETIEKIHEGTKHIPIPVFIGIMPLTSQRNAEFLHNEVPGIKLTPEVLARMQGLQGPEGRWEGLAISKELIDQAMSYFKGIYLITPFSYYEMTTELTKYVYERAQRVNLQAGFCMAVI